MKATLTLVGLAIVIGFLSRQEIVSGGVLLVAGGVGLVTLTVGATAAGLKRMNASLSTALGRPGSDDIDMDGRPEASRVDRRWADT